MAVVRKKKVTMPEKISKQSAVIVIKTKTVKSAFSKKIKQANALLSNARLLKRKIVVTAE